LIEITNNVSHVFILCVIRIWRHLMFPNPTGSMDICCECCVLSGGGLCDELITRPEESYRLWSVAICDRETSSTRSQISINCDWSYEISSPDGNLSR